ncbi:Aldo/keto reductase [Cryphonectria parasitica EP155]|uniref:Aldo/keto reductase n=1 Tax=Cryphonectria parasitica (strain ATCC 38755 / EP155) TaxID=660469 RepID=A0A9P4Y954_CRYP1|nr:Aldo/keto reductase [Cryphonectria parasitica EP155]KAF3768730.1 Aldo/keto reductase [Cryphonectria parasitica EP155]
MAAESIPPVGFGLLGFTWRAKQVPDEQAFSAMKAAINNGATMWSSSTVYGLPPEPPTAGLWLLRRYFEKYPEDASKVTLFIRGCIDFENSVMKCTREGVRASWEEADRILGGVKTIDCFGPARMDQNVPVEETIGALKELMDEGKIGSVGLSEVRAETIRRASAVCPIRFAEIEFSLWSTDMLHNGVAQAAKECNVILWCYAPLGYGFLTGAIKKFEDIPEGDGRRAVGRFQPENFSKNVELVDKLTEFARQKGVTPAQLALAWIRANSNTGVCGPLVPIPGPTTVVHVNENCKVVEISAQEKQELDEILESIQVVGHRQIPGMDHWLLT